MELINVPSLRVVEDDLQMEVAVDVRMSRRAVKGAAAVVRSGLDQVNEELLDSAESISALTKGIEELTSTADGLDFAIAVASGLLAGAVDSFWVGEFSFERGKAWSNRTVNEFVMRAAKAKGYDGDRLDGAIRFLEEKYPIPSDSVWKGKDIGVSARSHHLDDLAHHPTVVGLFFSILTQFTKEGYFQNSNGEFFPLQVDERDGGLIGTNVPAKVFAGTVNWFFHLVSDMSGSNKTAGVGMGIPGPVLSLVKELATVPGLDKTGLAKKIGDLFVKERFDFRAELAVAYELSRQAVPVVLNEVVVRSFYFVRRLVAELKTKMLEQVDWKSTLPWKNRTVVRMLTISTATFAAIDLADAAIRGAAKSGGDPVGFSKEVILRVNFVGLGRFVFAVSTDVSMGVRRERLRNERIVLMGERLHLMNAKVFYLQAEMWNAAETATKTIEAVAEIAEQSSRVLQKSIEENERSLARIGEVCEDVERQNPGLIAEISRILR